MARRRHAAPRLLPLRPMVRGLRRLAPRPPMSLIHAEPEEIALMKNTSEGISHRRKRQDWRAGDTVVAFSDEFPSNQYIHGNGWNQKSVKVKWLSFTDPRERFMGAVNGARLLAISFVQYLSGYRADLTRIGQICRDAGCIFFVDAIQDFQGLPAGRPGIENRHHSSQAVTSGCAARKAAPSYTYRCDNGIAWTQPKFGWTNVAGYRQQLRRPGHETAR